ncbi:MAG: hypothetical protein KY432_06800 [Acidobacteria bacterium]|nr:hypothetical protein [Acidobacteriota bacterium]
MRAFVEVDEQGTEASAATAVAMAAPTASLAEPEPPCFGPHPFLFVIRETEGGAILFLGRVADPSRAARSCRSRHKGGRSQRFRTALRAFPQPPTKETPRSRFRCRRCMMRPVNHY